MKNNEELNNQNLENVSGGESSLEKYLKTLAGKDKDKMSVDYGTGVALDLNPSVDYDDRNNVHIIKREKNPFEE